MQVKQKDYNLELIRTISIFLVILIHFCNYYTAKSAPAFEFNYSVALLYNVFARISVPLFFMISGALAFRKDFDFKKNNKKILHMIVVLITWNIIYWLWNCFFLDREMTINIISYIFIPVKNHLWYMYAYIAILIANPLTSIPAKHMKPCYENYFILAWLILCGGVRALDFMLDFFHIYADLKYSIPIMQSTYYLGYYLCGHILYKRIHDNADAGSLRAEKILSFKPIVYIGAAVLVLTFCFLITNYTSMITGTTNKVLFGYSNIMIMFPSVALFIALIKINVKGNRLLSTVGKLSFGVYLSHVLFLNIVYTLLDIRSMDSILMLPLLSLITLIVSLLFTAVTERIPILNKLLY